MAHTASARVIAKGDRKSAAPLSVIAMQIVREALKPDVSPADLGKLAESDPGFAIRVLSLVNSASFGFQRQVSDVRQAVSMIGVRGLRTLGMSLALSDMVPVGEDGQLLLANSLRRAVAAQLLAERLGERDVSEFFTIGLFLEVGLLARAREDLRAAAEVARLPALHRVMHERAAGTQDHAAHGAELAATFLLPAHMANAVERHHDEKLPVDVPARVAWAAERVAALWEGGDIMQTRATANDAMSALGLTLAQGEDVLNRLPELVVQAAAAFDREVGQQKSVEDLLVDVNRGLIEMTHAYESAVRRLERLLREKEELSEQLKLANDQLSRLATTDGLTGLSNKRALEDVLRRDLARADRDRTSLAVVITDVDHFKKVNDTYGHLVGDDVLRAISKELGRSLRAGDLAARYGGEEFVLVLPATNLEGARIAAERVRKAIEQARIAGPQGPLSVTASFGAAAVCGPGCTGKTTELLARADAALYVAKRGGRNRVVLASDDIVIGRETPKAD